MSLEFATPVPRWVRVRTTSERDDPAFEFDEDGFLPDQDEPASLAAGSMIRPQAVTDFAALVLLGEPGSGKTTTFEQLTGANSGAPLPAPGDSRTIWVTGSELTDVYAFQELVGVHLASLPAALEDGEPGQPLTIVLDQLDESAIVRGLPRHLDRALVGKDTRSLRALVACRTADYPALLTSVLQKLVGGCVVADLAPLTRPDVEELASRVGVDGRAFVEAVVASGVGMLANVPLTLKILLGAYREDPASLNQGSLNLFERGIARLADEHDRERRQGRATITSVEERVVIASRIASQMVLSGQRTVWIGDLAFASVQDVTVGMLAGGREHATGAFEVTHAAVDETLKTALFAYDGRNRVAFAHSSFGAFLAARYLATRLSRSDGAVRRQLDEMFLVAAPDEDSASIPVYLRETAAWLVARAPIEHRRLAAADPQGLMAHSAHITDSGVREVIVDSLLQRADEIELTHPSWQRTRWRLGHPGLAEQLRVVLTEPAATGWSSSARMRLAVGLSRHCVDSALAEPLLRVAETREWPILVRQDAAKVAMGTTAAIVVPRLRRLLASLAAQPQDDAADLDELVGNLLLLLWPLHLQLAEVLPHIRPITTNQYFGTYRSAVVRFPGQAADTDLAELLSFARGFVARALKVPEGEPLVGTDDMSAVSRRVAALASATRHVVDEITMPILDRATTAAVALEHLPAVVEIVGGLRCASVQMAMPAGFDLVDDGGAELESAVALRRCATEQLTKYLVENIGSLTREKVHLITSRWKKHSGFYTEHRSPLGSRRGERQHLVDGEDLPWLLARAQHHRANNDNELGEALVLIASQVADLTDPQTLELVYTLRDTSDWQHFPWLQDFESPHDVLAAGPVPESPATEPWEEAEEHAARQRARLDRAADGDTTAFWQLVADMTIDPSTGELEPSFTVDFDLFQLPGASLWDEDDLRSAFRRAARFYLVSENDHREEWLGYDERFDRRAEAGYTALRFFHREDALSDVPSERWPAWVGSILVQAHKGADPGSDPAAKALFARAVRHAQPQVADALGGLVRTALSEGHAPWKLPYMVAMLPTTMYGDLIDLAAEARRVLEAPAVPDEIPEQAAQRRSAAIAIWEVLLHPPLIVRVPLAVQLAEEALTNGTDSPLALAAGRVLLTTDAAAAWPQVHAAISASPDLAVKLAKSFAFVEHTRRVEGAAGVTESLNEEDLAAMFSWLAAAIPLGSEERRLYEWRGRILRVLAERGTGAAVKAVRSLAEAYPEDLDIKASLVAARREAQAQRAVLLTPGQVIDLLSDPERRVISTAQQLAEVVCDTLTQIGKDLEGHANVLWDRERLPVPENSPKGTRRQIRWRPKPEGTLAAYIAHELKLRLVRRGVVINREVVIKPTDDGDSGERPDILVEALATDPVSEHAATVAVPIEIKGSWHKEVLTAQRDQLAARYLRAARTDAGVYLVGWYPVELWDAEDPGPKGCAGTLGERQDLMTALTEQAAAIQRERKVRTLPCVLTIARASVENHDNDPVED